jgi:phage terminase large subunit
MLLKTTAQEKIVQLTKRIRVVRGGTSASKTFSIIPFLIEYALMNRNSVISVVSETIPHLRRGALRDFLKIMELTENFNPDAYNKSSLTYTFHNGSFIEFFSADSPAKLRGARRDVLFINECNNVEFESYQQLSIRTRDFIYLDYNPNNEFWVDTELIGLPDVELITLTYKDNEALDPAIVREIEKAKEKAQTSAYWANWWKVYGLGQLGSLEGVIFNNWKQIDTIPETAKLLGYGMDFGYTADPTSVIALYKHDNQYILHEVIYQTGLTNRDIYNLLPDKKGFYVADSAEPKSIVELQRMGLKIIGAEKGKDSIIHGIQLMQQEQFLVTSQSVNLIKELRNYSWDKDRNGQTIANKPIDAFNHGIDAMRYIMSYQKKYKTDQPLYYVH